MDHLKFNVLMDESAHTLTYQLLFAEDETLMTSGPIEDRDACIAMIRTALDRLSDEETYETTSDADGVVLELHAADGVVLARSRPLRDSEEATGLRDTLVEAAAQQEEYEIILPGTRSQSGATLLNAVRFRIAYSYDFAWESTSGAAGFEAFQSARDGQFYFHFNDAGGRALLFSRGFRRAPQRNARERMVALTGVTRRRYELKEEEGGRLFFILKARNGQEIARSRIFASADERDEAITWLLAAMAEYADAYARRAVDRKHTGDQLALESISTLSAAGFERLKNPADGRYYFLFRAEEGGRPLLFSQGYKSGPARDHAIQTLIRIGANGAAFTIARAKGRFGFVVRAANNQEIARSADFASEDEAAAAMVLVRSGLPIWAAAYGVQVDAMLTEEDERLFLSVDRHRGEAAIADAAGPAAAAGAAGLAAQQSDRAPVAVEGATEQEVTAVREPFGEHTAREATDATTPTVSTENESVRTHKDRESAVVASGTIAAVRAGAAQSEANDSSPERRPVAAAGSRTRAAYCCLPVAACGLFLMARPFFSHSGQLSRSAHDVVMGAASGPAARVTNGENGTAPAGNAVAQQAPGGGVTITHLTAASSSATRSPSEMRLDLPSGSMEEALASYLGAPHTAASPPFTMDRLKYPPNSHAMNEEGKEEVHLLARVLKAFPATAIEIHGHIDHNESEEYTGPDAHGGHLLSAIRAECLRLRLHYLGVPASDMQTVGEGAANPIADGDTEEARQRNRRLEIVVLPNR